ncbi:MAG: hypothetical protein ABIO37_13915 [Caulobacteraceae bacterium]
MRDTELAEIRAQLVAMAAVKTPPPKPSLFGRLKARAPVTAAAPHVGGPQVAPKTSPVEELVLTEVDAAPDQDDLPYFPAEPRRRSAFGQRTDTPDEPPLLLAHPAEPETTPTGALGLQKRLSTWLSTEQVYEVPAYAYAQDQPRRASDLKIAAELAETPFEPEDLTPDTTLADDLARARAAVDEVAAIVAADAAAPRAARAKAPPRRAAKPVEVVEPVEAADPLPVGAGLLDRLHHVLTAEQRRVDELLSSLVEPTALAA